MLLSYILCLWRAKRIPSGFALRNNIEAPAIEGYLTPIKYDLSHPFDLSSGRDASQPSQAIHCLFYKCTMQLCVCKEACLQATDAEKPPDFE